MLKIITGPSGSGKTEYIYSQAEALADRGKKLYFLVPEQDTVNAENILLCRLGNRANIIAETFNFSRLPNRVFRETGGLSHSSLDRAGRALVISAAIESVENSLCGYRKTAGDTGFVLKALDAVEELKHAGVGAHTLEELSACAEGARLKNKLSDLSLIYSAYNRLIKGIATDPSDDMVRLAKTLEEYDFFASSAVFIDGFYDFTAPQYDIIYRILYSADDVYITFMTGGDFPKTERAYRRIISLAVKCGISYEIISLDKNLRSAPHLELLQKSFSERVLCPDESENIHITACPTLYDECTAAARQIKKLLTEGVRCSDIAVCARGTEAYSGIIEEIFHRYGIPLHFERSEDITAKPIVRFVLSAFEVLESGWRLSDVKRFLKSGFLPIDTDELFLLENYAEFWNVSGTLWHDGRRWTMNPEGYTNRLTEESLRILDRVNSAKEAVTAPLLRLAEGMRAPRLKDKLAALNAYLKEHACGKVTESIAALRESGDFAAANEQAQLWNFVMDSMDQLAAVFGESNMGRKKLYGYLRLIFSEYNVSSLPTCLDEVVFGEAAFMRATGMKHLFLLGVNEGVFPALSSPSGLLTDKEKIWLCDHGAELSSIKSITASDEDFYFYLAVSRPREGLWLYYRKISLSDGKPARASQYIEKIKAVFPALKEEIFDPEEVIPMTESELFGYFLENPAAKEELSKLFPHTASRADISLDAMESLSKRGIIEGGISGDIKMTQAKFDTYKNCKYSYFLRYMLKLKEKKRAEFSYSETGTFIHKLLEDFMGGIAEKKIDITALSDKELRRLTDSSAHEYIKANIPFINEESVRFRHMMNRICKFLILVVKNLVSEFSQSSFKPIITEAKIGEDIKAYRIPLDDGSSMIFTGSIDRVDLYTSKSGKSYIRVVDYKTASGGKKFSLSDVREGINVQMLVYLFSAASGIKNKTDKAIPAGVIYVPAASPAIVSDTPLSQEEIEKKTQTELKRHGLILNEEEIIYAMEHSGEGKFIPARIGKNGAPLASSSIATLEQFGKLKRFLDKMFRATAEQLRRGEIDVDPFCRGKDSCQWCRFKPVCRFEGEGREYIRIDEKDFWRSLEDC